MKKLHFSKLFDNKRFLIAFSLVLAVLSWLVVVSSVDRNVSTQIRNVPLRVLRPSPASVAKVSGKYRYKLIIKCRNTRRLREMVSRLLLEFAKQKEFARVTAFADCNPDSIL